MRNIPLAAGSKPNCTSGKPSTVFLSSLATIALHASASSKPPPSAGPSTAATNGFFAFRFRSARASVPESSSASAARVIALSMSMFAPTTKLPFLPLESTAALICESRSTRSTAAKRSSPNFFVMVLSASFGSSSDTIATPSARNEILTIDFSAPSFSEICVLILPPPTRRLHRDHPLRMRSPVRIGRRVVSIH